MKAHFLTPMLIAGMLSAPNLRAQPRPVADYRYVESASTVVLGLVDSVGRHGASTAVIRRPSAPMHVVLVTQRTTPQDLAMAMAAVIHARRADGDTIALEMRSYVSSATLRTPLTRTSIDAASRDLARLRQAQPMRVPGLGVMPIILINIGATRRTF
jgi:hypothetical protein